MRDRGYRRCKAAWTVLGLLLTLGLATDRSWSAEALIEIDRVLELREGDLLVTLSLGSLGGRRLYVIRAELPRDARFEISPAERPQSLAGLVSPGPHVALNGGFYDEQGHAMGLVVENGVTIHPLRRRGGSGVLIHGAAGFRVVHRTRVPDRGVERAVQSIDRIVDQGRSLIGAGASPARDARSAVATFADGRARLYAVFAERAVARKRCHTSGCSFALSAASTSTGVTLGELADLLVAEGASAALNLDGGYSTSFDASLGGRSLRVAAFRATTAALIARPREEASGGQPSGAASGR